MDNDALKEFEDGLSTPNMGDTVEDRVAYLAGKREAVMQKLKDFESLKQAYDEAIKALLVTPKKINVPGYHISWAEVTSNRVDTKALKADHPDLAAQYTKLSVSQRLTISEIKA